MTLMKIPIRYDLLRNPAHRVLWEKILDGFREISGDGDTWRDRANYEHFWPLVSRLYQMAYGPKAVLPDELKGPLAFMLGGHAGRTRKGIRTRPYFHHILMVVYATWVLDLPLTVQKAAINHDDVEDVPKNLAVPDRWVANILLAISEPEAVAMVNDLTNEEHPDGKHAGQLLKMAKIALIIAILKLIDRLCNLFDMRQDKPKGFGPERIRTECLNALGLAAAMPEQAPDEVLALLNYAVELLARENNLPLDEAPIAA